jgi:hypothetical protein
MAHLRGVGNHQAFMGPTVITTHNPVGGKRGAQSDLTRSLSISYAVFFKFRKRESYKSSKKSGLSRSPLSGKKPFKDF